MRNALKVARWEFKRNMKNKSFLIGIFLTPVIMLAFMLIGSLFGGFESEGDTTRLFVNDNLGLFDALQETIEGHELDWELQLTDASEQEAADELASQEDTAYIFLDDRAIDENVIPVYTSEEIDPFFMDQIQVLATPLKTWQMAQLGLSEEQLAAISAEILFKEAGAGDVAASNEAAGESEFLGEEGMSRYVPGAFGGIILLSIVFSGMYIFQSASQEKKDKVAEIMLSSLTPGELMQGKIIGYFGLGMVQAAVFIGFAIPLALWKLEMPIVEYLLVPEVILYVFIAVLGYLLFAAMFVGVGATMADVSSAGNFQGLVMMLPFLPFVFIGPVVSDPNGLFAQIGTYIPFSAPGVLLLRLSLLREWPWIEIVIALVVLAVSSWLCMKLAGKIFKTGILMYGKNATPKEIWKWIRA